MRKSRVRALKQPLFRIGNGHLVPPTTGQLRRAKRAYKAMRAHRSFGTNVGDARR